jgi:hypothetical protein
VGTNPTLPRFQQRGYSESASISHRLMANFFGCAVEVRPASNFLGLSSLYSCFEYSITKRT